MDASTSPTGASPAPDAPSANCGARLNRISTKPRAYYNEHDPFAAQWLRNLIAAGHIAPGDVDERSIVEVQPDDLRGYTQCHFFAGIGGWSLALRMAGWSDDAPVWTGSCPCQPFSSAGKQRGQADERHLWPEFRRLIRECRPPFVFGEQVAGAIVLGPASAAAVPNLSDREAVRRVLCELERSAPLVMHGVRTRSGEGAQAAKPGGGQGAPEGMARRVPGTCSRERSEAPCAVKGHRVRSVPGRDTGADRRGLLRDDGHPIRPDNAARVERAVSGSNPAWGGLHALQCAGGAVRTERDGEHLGAEPNPGDSASDQGTEDREVERLLGSLGAAADAEVVRPWLDAVRSDLEQIGYSIGACVLPAAGVGAPHIRQRLWWVANADSERHDGEHSLLRQGEARWIEAGITEAAGRGGSLVMADRDNPRLEEQREQHARAERAASERGGAAGFWSDLEWLPCRDGKARPTQPGLQPLAYGVSGRVGRLRAYGNAIVPQVAAEFVGAFMEIGRGSGDRELVPPTSTGVSSLNCGAAGQLAAPAFSGGRA